MSPFRGQTPVPRHALHVMNTTIQSSSVSVGWTVDPEVLFKVKEKEEKGLQSWMMLLVFDKNKKREERKIVPLRDCIAYLSLRSVGEARVFGQVLCGTKKDIYRTWLSQEGNDWEFDARHVKAMDTNGVPDNLVPMGYGFVGPEMVLNLQVPAEAFAPPPPEWESSWVNYFFHTTPRDQCAYRRRRILAYTIQPALALVFLVALAVIQLAGLLVTGAKPNLDAWRGIFWNRESAFSGNLNSKWEDGVGFITFPVLWWGPAIASALLARWTWPETVAMCTLFDAPRSYVVAWGALGAVAFPAMILAGLGIAVLLKKLVVYTQTEKTVERMKAALTTVASPFVRAWRAAVGLYHKLMMLQDEDIDVLSMPWQQGGIYSIDDLPVNKRTIRLRFQDFKAKVCRPFAR